MYEFPKRTIVTIFIYVNLNQSTFDTLVYFYYLILKTIYILNYTQSNKIYLQN